MKINHDSLQRFLFDDMPIRGEIVHLNRSYKEIMQMHAYSLAAQQLLGEALALVTLLTAIIKFDGRLTIQFQGTGRLKLLLVQCNHHFQMRGLIQADNDMSTDELLDELRQGVLVIMMDPENSGKRYQGVVAWKGETLAESIEGYFTDSEQLLTRIWIAVNENQVAGLLLQKMPAETSQTDDATADEDALRQWEHLTILTDTIKPEELCDLETEVLLKRLYSEENVRLFTANPIEFRCTCSVIKGENAILMLGQEEAEAELRDSGLLIVTCEFCNKQFQFDRVDVAKIFHQGGTPPSSQQIH